MTSNSLGYIIKDSDVEQLTVAARPINIVVVGDTGDMTDKAVGTHKLNVPGTDSPLVLPAGYTVYRTDIRVVTAPTSANSTATVALGTTAPLKQECFNSAEVVTSFPLADSLITADNPNTHTATPGEAVAFTVGVEALSAGRMLVYLNLYASTSAV